MPLVALNSTLRDFFTDIGGFEAGVRLLAGLRVALGLSYGRPLTICSLASSRDP